MVSRRLFLRTTVAIAGLAALPCGALAQDARRLAAGGLAPEPQFPLPTQALAPEVPPAERLADRASGETRRIRLYNVHTKESLDKTYFASGEYDSDVLSRISYFLRDWRAEAAIDIDPTLVDAVAAIQSKVGSDEPLYVLSGYRTPATNAWLATFNRDVARNSFHLRGKAIDIFQPGYSLETLRNHALALQAGGVGFYPGNGFIHVDTGPIRSWTSNRSPATDMQEARSAP